MRAAGTIAGSRRTRADHGGEAEIARHEGRPPRGWLGPWISESEITPDLLKRPATATCSTVPRRPAVALKTRAGPLLSVPYPQEANDANAIVVRRMTADASRT